MKVESFFLNKNIDKDVLFLDIETTGFSVDKDFLLVIGIGEYFNEHKTRITLLKSEYEIAKNCNTMEKEEELMVLQFLNYIFSKNYLIYYNNFDSNFIKNKVKKYISNFDFSTLNFINLSENINNFKKLLLKVGIFENEKDFNLNRLYIEEKFKFNKSSYYDLNKIIKQVKKDNFKLNNSLIEHSKEELNTILDIYNKLNEIKKSNSFKYKGNTIFIYDYFRNEDTLTFYFKININFKIGSYFMENGDKIETLVGGLVKVDLISKMFKLKDRIITIYEVKDSYVPLVIDGDLIYENIYRVFVKNFIEMI